MVLPDRRCCIQNVAAIAISIFTLLQLVLPVRAQSVQAAIALIQLFNSMNASGPSTKWIKLEFDALNLKVDTVLKNQERLAVGIQSLSQQIGDLEKAFSDEINSQPFKAVLARLIQNNAAVNDLANYVDNVGKLTSDLKPAGYLDARQRLDRLKDTIPDVFAELSGINLAYSKLKYSMISRAGMLHAQLISGIGLLDIILDRELQVPPDRVIWYLQKFTAIQQGVRRFTYDDVLKPVHASLKAAYYDYRMQVPSEVSGCFWNFGGSGNKHGSISVTDLLNVPIERSYLGQEIDLAYRGGSKKVELEYQKVCATRSISPPRTTKEVTDYCRPIPGSGGGGSSPDIGCELKVVRTVEIFREHFTLGTTTLDDGYELLPSKAIAIYYDGIWIVRLATERASMPTAKIGLFRYSGEGSVKFVYDKIISNETNLSEEWLSKCVMIGEGCEADPVAEGQKPSKFVDAVENFAIVSSARALEINDFERSVRELKALGSDVGAEIARLNTTGKL